LTRRWCCLDVTDSGAFTLAMLQILDAWGGVDVVILSAGTYMPMRAGISPSTPPGRRCTATSSGWWMAWRRWCPSSCASGVGRSPSSAVAGYRGSTPEALAYGPSKAALINFAETLYLELAPHGVSVFLINPGFVATHRLMACVDFEMPALVGAPDAAARSSKGWRGAARDPLSPTLHADAQAVALPALPDLLPGGGPGVRRSDG
jgi:NAD(P)-dependent dehydrogenase (short-subunit alcohol dehydrogenase family)